MSRLLSTIQPYMCRSSRHCLDFVCTLECISYAQCKHFRVGFKGNRTLDSAHRKRVLYPLSYKPPFFNFTTFVFAPVRLFFQRSDSKRKEKRCFEVFETLGIFSLTHFQPIDCFDIISWCKTNGFFPIVCGFIKE